MNQPTDHLSTLHHNADFEFAFRIKQPQPVHPQKCVILLHGVGGSETNLSDLAAKINPETLVVLPRAPIQIAPMQFAWFNVSFTANGPSIVAEEAERNRLALIRFVEQIQYVYDIAPQHTVIAGFSQGGIMSASVALSAPEVVGAFGVLSGRILPELQPHLAAPVQFYNLNAFIAHGEYDSKLPVAWAHRSDQLLSRLRVKHQTNLYPVDHMLSSEMQADFIEWLQNNS